MPSVRTDGALRALRFRDFRLIAVGNMVSQLGTWGQYVAMGWVARDLTDNTVLISMVFAAQWLPFLVFSPITGVVADRLDRRKLVLWGNLAMIGPAVALGLLIGLHHISIASLVALVIVGGIAQAFTQPAGNAFIPALVPERDLHSAVSLNAGLSSSTRVIGPTIGGLVISRWGVAWGFHVNAISYLAVAIACIAVRARPARKPPSAVSYGEGLRSGLTYLRRHPAAMRIMVLNGVVTFLMMHAGLMAILAKDVLHGGAGTYGLLSSGPGFGFVFAAVLSTMLTDMRHRTLVLFLAAAATGAALVIVGISRSVPVSVAGMGLYGVGVMTLSTVSSTLLLAATDDDYRGRIMGLFGVVSIGMFTVNSLIGGALASFLGAPVTIWICGLAILASVAVFALSGSLGVIRSGMASFRETAPAVESRLRID